MTYPILCDGPGPHEPADGVLGESSIEHTTGMRCAAPACQPVGDTTEATAVTVDAAAIDAALAAAQKATTVAALRAAVVSLAQQLQSS